jgi:hypothetical protein
MPRIQQWDVYFVVNSRHAKPLPKDKFVIVACFDPNPCGFFINTKVNDFIQKNAQLMACEVLLTAAAHPFLSYDSWLDCREMLSFQESELIDKRGVLASNAIVDALAAVEACPVLRPRFKRLIRNA